MSTAAAVLIDPTHYNRSQWVGSSDIGAIIGANPYRNRLDVFLDKADPNQREETPAMRRGRRMEPVLLDWVAEDFGLSIEHRGRRWGLTDVRHAAEIDGEYREGSTLQNVEIKTAGFGMGREFTNESDGLPLHYIAQTQWGLYVTAREICRVFVWIGDELRPYWIERDDSLIQLMAEEGVAFFDNHIKPAIAPAIEPDHARMLETLKRLFPGTDGTTRTATPADEHWYAVLAQASEQASRYESVVDAAKAHLLETMGESAQLLFEDGQALKRAVRNRKGYEVAPTTYVDARIGKPVEDKPAKPTKTKAAA